MTTTKAEKIRREIKANDDKRDAGLERYPADVERFDDIVYGPDRRFQVLDVYRPAGSGKTPLPVIVSVHGGGWIYGTKETYQFYCMDLARRGFAVVNFTYRLAPEDPFPACLEDTCSVFGWVLDNAGEYGFDREHVFSLGDSAGGHILALFCEMCADPDYRALFDFKPPEGFAPTAVALNCGAYRYKRAKAAEKQLLDATGNVTDRFPPTFLMTSTGDFLANDALKMAKALAEKLVPFELHYYGSKDNRLGHVFHCDTRLPDAQRCNDDECAFFRKFI